MKTNVSIKFNSIEEYREIERVLEGLGYVNLFKKIKINIKEGYVCSTSKSFAFYDDNKLFDEKVYNSLQEFLKD